MAKVHAKSILPTVMLQFKYTQPTSRRQWAQTWRTSGPSVSTCLLHLLVEAGAVLVCLCVLALNMGVLRTTASYLFWVHFEPIAGCLSVCLAYKSHSNCPALLCCAPKATPSGLSHNVGSSYISFYYNGFCWKLQVFSCAHTVFLSLGHLLCGQYCYQLHLQVARYSVNVSCETCWICHSFAVLFYSVAICTGVVTPAPVSNEGISRVLVELTKKVADVKEQVAFNTRLLQELTQQQKWGDRERVRLPCELPLQSYEAVLDLERKLKSKYFYSKLVCFISVSCLTHFSWFHIFACTLFWNYQVVLLLVVADCRSYVSPTLAI